MTVELMAGATAIARTAITSGCRFFAGYPMLPFTDLLEAFDAELPGSGGVCISADTEIEAINMTLGAAMTGARAATGSCGQGVALMQEAVAEGALNETPFVLFLMARGQQDYFQATRGGGWGDYRTITFAPKDVREAVEHTELLFHLTDRYRAPGILYGDYLISHTQMSVELQPHDLGPLPEKDWALDASTGGTGYARQIWTWAVGRPTNPGIGPNAHWQHLAEKFDLMAATEARHETYRADDAEHLVVCFGTASPFVDNVVDELRTEGHRVGSFRPVTLWPFPGDALRSISDGCRTVLVFELNAGQMIDDVRIHAADRDVIRAIGGVSQDESGMRQGTLLTVPAIRERILQGMGAAT